MSTITEDTDKGIDPETEVRKLQDLVKKLEQQNQLLRNKQNDRKTVISADNATESVSRTKLKGSEENSPKNISLEDVALIDLDQALTDDEEDSWLYKSPQKVSPAQRNMSPYKWMKHDSGRPSPEIESSRRSLNMRLDEMARISRNLASLGSPVKAVAVPSELPRSQTSPGPLAVPLTCSPADNANDAHSEISPELLDAAPEEVISFRSSSPPAVNHQESLPHPASMPSIRQPLVSGLGARVNTGTFTRPKKVKTVQKKKLDFSNDVDSDELVAPKPTHKEDLLNDSGGSAGSFGSQEDLLDGEGATVHKLSDVNDVQVLAKMQEESLRQSLGSPHMSPRKSSLSNTYTKSGMSRMKKAWTEDSEHISPNESTRSSPGRFEGERLRQEMLQKSNNSLASGSSQSNSPPDSPYGSQFIEPEKHRRSLPNLSKSFGSSGLSVFRSGTGSKESPPRMMNKSPVRARNPGSGARQASPGRTLSPADRTLSPARTASPQRSGIPGPRASGLPRPGSASKLPTPRRSGIPPPRKPNTTGKGVDDSWKDGCF